MNDFWLAKESDGCWNPGDVVEAFFAGGPVESIRFPTGMMSLTRLNLPIALGR